MLYREALIWKRLTHDNIVPFRGVTLEPLQIISEWMPNGDLTAYIKKNPNANRVNLVRPPIFLTRTAPPHGPSAARRREGSQIPSRLRRDSRRP